MAQPTPPPTPPPASTSPPAPDGGRNGPLERAREGPRDELLEHPLGVIAGAGLLPRLVAEAQSRGGGSAFIVGLRGAVEDWMEDWPHASVGLGQVGAIFSYLKRAGCRRVCFAGGLARPSLLGLRPDWTGLKVLARVARLMRRGDDALLRGLAQIFEEHGFALVGPHELLSDQLAPAGALTERRPAPRDLADMVRARAIVEALGRVDVGQGAVVAHGRCLSVETIQGTDAMLKWVAGQPKRAGAPIPSGVLYKAPKPDQDRRLDLPAIGPNTIREAKAAGLNGVAIEAGAVFLLDVAETAAAARAEGLFVYGLGAEEAAEIGAEQARADARDDARRQRRSAAEKA